MRATVQQRVVKEVFTRARRPLRPDEVLAEARVSRPQLGMATVYRTIRSLLEKKEISIVELPGQPAHYEVFDGHHHHHFHCRACNRIFEVESCPMRVQEIEVPGFLVENHQVTLYGLCAECRKN